MKGLRNANHPKYSQKDIMMTAHFPLVLENVDLEQPDLEQLFSDHTNNCPL